MRRIGAYFRAGLARTAAAATAICRRLRSPRVEADRRRPATIEEGGPAAEAVRRLRSQVLSTVGQEFRAPLNGMLGAARLLLDTPLSAEQRDHVRTLCSSGEALIGILNDIHDFSKLEAGTLEVESVPLDLRALVGAVRDLLAADAGEKGIALSATVADDVPRFIRSDPLRLRQVLLAVVGNAVKFTERGGVSVRAACGDGTVAIEVVDSGIGMDDATRAGLFEGFRSGIAGRHRGGTGLGLAIGRRLLDRMGGSIAVDSAPGAGSTVRVAIPLVASDAPPPPAGDMPPLHVLLAEDNPVSQRIVDAILSRCGHHVAVASDGAAAVRMVAERDFDAVLMDMQMPEMDGLEATRLIRAMPGPRSGVPIIALTANTMKGDEERCLAAGMDAFIAKPVNPEHLIQSLRIHVLGRGAARVPPQPRAQPRVGGTPDGGEPAEFDLLQLEHSMALLGRDVVVEVLHRFEGQAADFAAAVQAGDGTALVRAAHGIAGCARYVGLPRLGRTCAMVETAWSAGDEAQARKMAQRAVAEAGSALTRLRGELGVAADRSSTP